MFEFESTQSKSAIEEGGEHGWSVHYIHEASSFVPLVQVRRASAMALSATTDAKALMEANGGVYDIEQDPLWHGEQRQVPRSFERKEMAFYQCDHLGTPPELTGHEGSIAWSAQYNAWGEAREAISEAGRRAGFRNPIRFQRQYWDEETRLHYNQYRYYDPRLGRFLSRDPMGLLGGINTHAYSLNPTEWIDPLGLSARKPQCPINGAAIYAEKRSRIEALIAQHDYADAGHINSNPQIPGGVSGAIVNERITGLPTGGKWHAQKGSDILGRLKK